MTVDLITFCHPKHIHKLHAEDFLRNMVASHKHLFDSIIVVHQRCQDIEYTPFDFPARIVESENYPDIWQEFGFTNERRNKQADAFTHGPDAPHYWRWHVLNHLIGLKESEADYIVFSDCDCDIKESPNLSWIEIGMQILQNFPDVLIVSPGDGGEMAEKHISLVDNVDDFGRVVVRLTQNVSQQMFLCERRRFLEMDFDLPWDWEYIAPGGPFQEYYYLFEGRMWRWMHKHDLWRAILPDSWRYWHWQWD